MNFSICTYKYENFAQSQQNCAPPHDGETVTFRNSVLDKRTTREFLGTQACKPAQKFKQSFLDTQEYRQMVHEHTRV